jgi:hypothetical protein
VSPDTSLRHVNETSNTPDAFGDEFVELWKTYPRKDDSKKSLRAYSARRLAGVPAEDLLTATVNYRQQMEAQKIELKFIKCGWTFFGSDEPWRDYLQPVTARAGNGQQAEEDQLVAYVRYGQKYAHKDAEAFQSLLRNRPELTDDQIEAAWSSWRDCQSVAAAS